MKLKIRNDTPKFIECYFELKLNKNKQIEEVWFVIEDVLDKNKK